MKAKLGAALAVLFGIVLVMVSGAYFMDRLGIVDVRAKLANKPVERLMSKEKFDNKPTSSVPAEEDKLKVLQENIDNLNKKVTLLSDEKEQLIQEKAKLESQVAQLESQINAAEEQELGYQKLAVYYSEMKPKEAVPILEELDDDTVLNIFKYLDDSVVSKLLELIEPKRAAQLVNKMTN